MLNPLQQEFLKESGKLISDLEESFLCLDYDRSDPKLAHQLSVHIRAFRQSAEKAKYDQFARCMAEMELLVNVILRGKTDLAQKLMDLNLALITEIRARLISLRDTKTYDQQRLNVLLDLMREISVPLQNGQGAGFVLKIGDLLAREGFVDQAKIQSALAQQKHLRDIRKEKEASEDSSSILVSAKNLDHLVNLIGELITLQTRLNQLITIYPDQEIIAITHGIDQLTNNMRDTAMNIRMLGIGTVFNRFKRLSRDLGEKFDREIDLAMEGGELEMDKTVIELLDKPLIDLFRFCIVWDLESPEQRKALGKPPKGHVRISAQNQSGQILVRIVSDGRGIGRDFIQNRIAGLGVKLNSQELTEMDLNLIFTPEFWNAPEMGIPPEADLDMTRVKKAVDDMRGSIEVVSEPGKGVEFRIMLPFTLAIFHGLLIALGPHYFLLPLYSVQECVEKSLSMNAEANENGLALVRGEMIPYISLRKLIQVEGDPPGIEYIVITSIERRRVGFVVDKVIGELQTVIKPLGKFLHGAEWFYGATILGDGTIALILNIVKLSSYAEVLEKNA